MEAEKPEKTPEQTLGPVPPISDEAIEQMRQTRFQMRVQRVLEVMRQERIDWRGLPFLTPDGRVAARVVPVEMVEP